MPFQGPFPVSVLVHVDSTDLYKTGHMANRWFGTVSRRLGRNIRASAPRRTGKMKQGIRGKMTAIPQAHRMRYDLVSSMPYTVFVLRGTSGQGKPGGNVIVSDGYPEKKMGPLPPWGGYPGGYRLWVEGQKKNNFLQKGWSKTMLRHPALRPMPGFIKHP